MEEVKEARHLKTKYFCEKRKVLDSNPVFNDTLRSLGESLKISESRENWTVVLKGTFNS